MPLILGTNSIKDTGYDVANSLRFNSGSSDYLNKTFGTPTSTKKGTHSFWFKLADDFTSVQFSGVWNNYYAYDISIDSSNRLNIYSTDTSTNTGISLDSTQVLRDPSAWYHVVVAIDTTQATASNRAKVYLNGLQITDFDTETYPNLNADLVICLGANNGSTSVGRSNYGGGANYYSGYMTEFIYVDGSQLDQTSFGAFNPVSNIWEPIAYAGTYGTNGFRFDFADSSALGNDVSGNDNDYTVNNLTSVDQSADTCSNNFATFNPVVNAAGNNLTLSEGNLKVTSGDNNWNSAIGTIAVNSGKWYWEVKIINATYNYNHGVFSLDTGDINDTDNPMNQTGYSGFYNTDGGETRIDDTVSTSDFGTFAADDILGFYLNADDNQFTIYKNGSSHVSATNLGNGRTDLVPIAVHYNGGVSEYNFGNSPFSISSGNADANGYGNFEYSPTIGGVNYYALCTKNLAEFGG